MTVWRRGFIKETLIGYFSKNYNKKPKHYSVDNQAMHCCALLSIPCLNNSGCATVVSEGLLRLSVLFCKRVLICKEKTKRAKVMRSPETEDVLSRSAYCGPGASRELEMDDTILRVVFCLRAPEFASPEGDENSMELTSPGGRANVAFFAHLSKSTQPQIRRRSRYRKLRSRRRGKERQTSNKQKKKLAEQQQQQQQRDSGTLQKLHFSIREDQALL